MSTGARFAGVAVLLALSFPMAAAAPARADQYCQLTKRPIASVLVVHGGAWSRGSAALGHDVCSPLAAMGYRVRMLEYPLGTVPGAVQYARDAAKHEARRGLPVYAAGVSAGGSMAEYLAVKSEIDGAVAVAPLSDFVDWRPPSPRFWEELRMTPAMRQRFSPYHNIGASAPLRIVHSRRDELIPYEQSVRMVRRCGEPCELVTLGLGGHIATSFGSQLPVLQWFARRARHPSFARPRRAAAPVISGASLRPRRFAPARARAGSVPRPPRAAPRRGTTFSYALSAPARVEFAIERKHGEKRRASCPRTSGRTARRCRGHELVGSFAVHGVAGSNRTRFSGILGRRALPPGRYRATLVATSSSGLRSRARRLWFRVSSSSRPTR